MKNDIEKLMLKYLKKNNNEVPVFAIITYKNKIIAKSCNKKESKKDITAHAEIIAIKRAAKKMKSWNLSECELYVSLKPCKMCEEIINQSRINKVYYFLDKPSYKKEYKKTEYIYIQSKNFINKYQKTLADFFKNKR